MEHQTYKNYKPLKLPWAIKLAPLSFLAGAVTIMVLEGSIEGWNTEVMKKQAKLTENFEIKYQEIISGNNKYLIKEDSIGNYLKENDDANQIK